MSAYELTCEMGTLSRRKRYALSETLSSQLGDVLVAHGTLKLGYYNSLLSRIDEVTATGSDFEIVPLSGDTGPLDQRHPGLSSSENLADVPER